MLPANPAPDLVVERDMPSSGATPNQSLPSAAKLKSFMRQFPLVAAGVSLRKILYARRKAFLPH
jgi:hypothetical protein